MIKGSIRFSKLFGKTMRQNPSDVDTVSHRLMVKAGMIHQLAAGIYSYLPLAWRVMRRIEDIVREEMDAIDAQELLMPALQPIDLWEETDRHRSMGQILFRLRDRKDRQLLLGPTHEEVITDLARRNVRSYRDLPLLVYQIQVKFRDEPRPRGGLMRVREFAMKDLYSFDVNEEALDQTYHKVLKAYENIMFRCGLKFRMVEADSGAIGGKESHEFMVEAPTGENEIIYCTSCGYAANAERAEIKVPPLDVNQDPRPREKKETPGVKTIAELAEFMDIPTSQTWKAVFYMADEKLVMATIRGDLEVNEVKLKNWLKAVDLRPATEEEIVAAGLVPGSSSPIGVKGIRVINDSSIKTGSWFAAGANQKGYHYLNVNYGRDLADLGGDMGDITLAQAGHLCPKCGATLSSTQGIEVGHTFKLGTIYSEKMGATFLDSSGKQIPLVMGCYGLGPGRLLAAAIEQHHDAKGIIWPISIAPFQIHLCALGMDNPRVADASERLYHELKAAGLEVLFDDREETPGVKFNDADLIGLPLRLTVSPRTLEQESVEVKKRHEKETYLEPLPSATKRIKELIEKQLNL